ncbi:C40 family peptidase [Streptomyces sp. KM77-8]|uniref:C40 family peptidase n=1 Tax=Streptomyces haneummycinicus TaxID=3074435 RepID=A0AAT9HX92_9ACTN
MRRTPRLPGRRTATVFVLACALTVTGRPPAGAEPVAPTDLTQVRAELERLYHDAEKATDRYNATEEKVTRQREHVRTLRVRIARAEERLSRLRTRAGAAARAQYRGGGLPAEVQFVLAKDPDRALDDATRADQAHRATRSLLTALETTRADLRDRRDDADTTLERLRKDRRELSSHRTKIEERIAAAQLVESRLASEQRRELEELERREAEHSHAEWVDTGAPDGPGAEAGAAGRAAIAYATRQLGKPYVWGAEGPDSFDCSGLTSQAWLAAGVAVPRTSQEQWRRLRHVPVRDMRPGDLIIYFSDASHVSLYIGEGRMIHAPGPAGG